jgi:hypothetical protein
MRRNSILAGLILAVSTLASGSHEGQIDSPREEKIIKIGEEVAGDLMRNLKTALTRAMQEGGPQNAIRICKEQALALTAKTAERYPGVQVRRTSIKFRNPANRPDSLDETVLNDFNRTKEAGRMLPRHDIRQVQLENGRAFRYYQPISTSGFCLSCHGTDESIPEDVASLLEKEYPDDRAVGYGTGDFRGVISVQIPESALP